MCQLFGLGGSWGFPTGGYHHRQRVCQPSGLEKVQDFNLALGQKTSIWIEARRAGTTSAGVEGPGSNAPQTATRPGGPIQPGFSYPSKTSDPWVCQPFGLGDSKGPSTGGYHHRQRVCQPFGLEKVQRLPFGLKPGDFNLAISPETSIWHWPEDFHLA